MTRASRVPWGRHRRPRGGFPRPRTCPGRGFAAPPRRARRWLAEVVCYANEPDPSRTCGPRCPRAPPEATVGVLLQALDPACSREGTMPRSFLVKTHSSHRVPNYGKLETQRGRGWPDLRPQHSALGAGGSWEVLGSWVTPAPGERGRGQSFPVQQGTRFPSGLKTGAPREMCPGQLTSLLRKTQACLGFPTRKSFLSPRSPWSSFPVDWQHYSFRQADPEVLSVQAWKGSNLKYVPGAVYTHLEKASLTTMQGNLSRP